MVFFGRLKFWGRKPSAKPAPVPEALAQRAAVEKPAERKQFSWAIDPRSKLPAFETCIQALTREGFGDFYKFCQEKLNYPDVMTTASFLACGLNHFEESHSSLTSEQRHQIAKARNFIGLLNAKYPSKILKKPKA